MTITKIVAKSKYYELVLENNEKLILPEDIIVFHRLIKGKTLTTNEIENLRLEAENYRFYEMALRYVNYPKTTDQVKKYLYGKNASREVITAIINKLKTLKLIDDTLYAKQLITKQASMKQLRFELKQKGLDEALIEQILMDYDEQASLQKIIDANVKRYVNKPDGKVKMYRYLVAKGFEYQMVDKILSNYFKS